MVTIRRQSTRQAEMPTIPDRLTDFCATCTRLRRSPRVNLDQQSSGTLSLVRKHVNKSRPSGILNRLAQYPTGKSLDVQIFDGNQPVFVYNPSTQLMVEIRTLVSYVDVHSLHKLNSFSPSIRALLTSRYASLGGSQNLLPGMVVAGIVNGCSVVQRNKVREPNIEANHTGIKRQWRGRDIARKQGEPSPCLSLDRQDFSFAFQRAMQIDPHLANLWDTQPVLVNDGFQVLAKRHAVIAPDGSETRIARLLPCLNTPEEALKGQINTSDYVFKDKRMDVRYIWSQWFKFGKLGVLLEPRNRLAIHSPRVSAFLKRGVVKLAAQGEMQFQRFLLGFARVDAVAKRFNHSKLYHFSARERVAK